MATTSTARIANDSLFCDARVAMEKIIERLLAMASEGASVDQVTRLLATDGTAMLRDLVQSYVDRSAAQELRVEVVGADDVERPGSTALRRWTPRWDCPTRSTATSCDASSPKKVRSHRSTRSPS